MGRWKQNSNEQALKLEKLSSGWPRALKHPLHPQHRLEKTLRPHSYNCDACDSYGQEWSFYCSACDFDVHPECALKAEVREVARSWPKTLRHGLHREHRLLLRTGVDSYFCRACAEKGHGWAFGCEEYCDVHMHPGCALKGNEGDAAESVVHEIVRTEGRGEYWCSGCGEEGKGWSYRCESCDVDMHPKCARRSGNGRGGWPGTVQHGLHAEHPLVRTTVSSYQCGKCEVEGRGWIFYCEECNYGLHPKCAVEVAAEEEGEGGLGWLEKLMHAHQRQHDRGLFDEEEREEEKHSKEGELRGGDRDGGEEDMTASEIMYLNQLKMQNQMAQMSLMNNMARMNANMIMDSGRAIADLAPGGSSTTYYQYEGYTNPYGWQL